MLWVPHPGSPRHKTFTHLSFSIWYYTGLFHNWIFAADIRKSDQNVKLANKHKPNIAHKYLSSSEYPVLECRLYKLLTFCQSIYLTNVECGLLTINVLKFIASCLCLVVYSLNFVNSWILIISFIIQNIKLLLFTNFW